MLSLYLAVKLLHIFLAITAVGFTLAFFVISSSKDKTREQLHFQLHLCHRLEAIAVPCFVLLLLSGLGMKFLGNLAWGTLWFVSSLSVMLVALALKIQLRKLVFAVLICVVVIAGQLGEVGSKLLPLALNR